MAFFFAVLFVAVLIYVGISISNKVIMHEFASSVFASSHKPLLDISLVSKASSSVYKIKRIVKIRKVIVLETWDREP